MNKLGDAMAHIPGSKGAKSQYRKIGTVFKRDEGDLVIKIDTLPIPGSGWEGWVNVWTDASKPRATPTTESDADIPF